MQSTTPGHTRDHSKSSPKWQELMVNNNNNNNKPLNITLKITLMMMMMSF